MQIRLNEFEQVIDEVILKRGLSYFKKGAILSFSESFLGEYEAVVAGSEDYTVSLKTKNDTVIEHHCNCPYDLGPVCKHIVATIFYLTQDELQLNAPQVKIIREKKTPSVAQQIKELLKTISHQELMAFVVERSKLNKEFGSEFLATFGHLSTNQSKESFQKQVQAVLKVATGNDGWIDWSAMKYVVSATQPLLDNAENQLEKNNFEYVFYISTALLEEMTKAFQYADDNNGELVYFAESALELLLTLAQEKLPYTLRAEFFEYCISSFNKKIFEDWDWHLGMLHLAGELVDIESEADIILNSLNAVSGAFEREQSQSFKLDLLMRFKGEKEVEEYIEQHFSNTKIRRKVIETAFENKNFDRVIQLAEEGIKFDKKDKPGVVKVWYNWLLKVAQAQKDTSKVIEYARFLFKDNFYPEQDYYQILKRNITNENWVPFLEQLIAEISSKNNWTDKELIRRIYIIEKWWDRLFLMVEDKPSLEDIEENEQYLAKDYGPELVTLYSDCIVAYVEKHIGRNHYQTACRYLRRMKKLGGMDEVLVIVELLKNKYPQRRALLEELSRV